ncbi:RHS repeat-associated core domain-containing protein [Lysinibacillus sp. CNPSo 3705]|uniref:RHS repeat-associated core domain-containing protein n=1 Tax=Lysinibacillus sp. CNPSo 3705 TaxID=3028148 RepID=UPI002363B05F|nr:RHS repeat-associated core domain-containing protein [Lysinibacillus sp. CNPSo 3705]MDD1504426.1 RHS repeat-associated core domain-containing protein [Lysinibacillus sp. CNPSo 3705]
MLSTISRTHIIKVIKRGNKTTFILFFLQSIRLLQNGVTAATYDYDLWGNLLSAEPTDSRIKGQPIRYAGYVYDIETKLYYLQARYYDPATARFISRDPDPGDEDDPVTMNGYTYGDDNPITKTDPDGKWVWVVVNAGLYAFKVLARHRC